MKQAPQSFHTAAVSPFHRYTCKALKSEGNKYRGKFVIYRQIPACLKGPDSSRGKWCLLPWLLMRLKKDSELETVCIILWLKDRDREGKMHVESKWWIISHREERQRDILHVWTTCFWECAFTYAKAVWDVWLCV